MTDIKNIQKYIKYSNHELGVFNFSHYFLLPSIKFIPITSYNKEDYIYVNTFIGDNSRKIEVNKKILVLYKIKDFSSDNYKIFNDKILKNKYYIFNYFVGTDNENYNYVMYVFKSKDEDYDNIINGRYSKCTSFYKNLIIASFSDFKMKVKLSQIFNKDILLKSKIELDLGCKLSDNSELYSLFGDKEIFRNEEK